MRALFRGIRFLGFVALVLLGLFLLLTTSSKSHAASKPSVAHQVSAAQSSAQSTQDATSARDSAAKKTAISQTIENARLLTIDSAIGPAVSDYIVRGLNEAQREREDLVVLQLNTPGGLLKSMREIIVGINQSKIPVVTFVAPSGAHAASAGTFILYASHIAAMAPATNLGAASPVMIGGLGGDDETKDQAKKSATEPSSTLERKAMNDAVAYIRSLAELRGRNAEWAEEAVRQASSISANVALDKNVIDLMADDLTGLMKKIDGRQVDINGQTIQLNTKNVTIRHQQPDARSRFLGVITDPTFAYILMLIGIYGILIEVIYPGMIIPGVAGIIAILIATYAFALLPINYVGLALIVTGIGFMIAEVFITSYGVLGAGGVVAFIIGSIMLIDTDVPGFDIATWLIISVGIVTGLFMAFLMQMAVRSELRPVVSGREAMIGSVGTVVSVSDDGEIKVRVTGELWQAVSDDVLGVGQKVTVLELNGLVLQVKSMS